MIIPEQNYRTIEKEKEKENCHLNVMAMQKLITESTAHKKL